MKRAHLLIATLVLIIGLLVVAFVLTQATEAPSTTVDTHSITNDSAIDMSAEDEVINALSGSVNLHTGGMFKEDDPEVCGIYDPNAEDASNQCSIETE